MRVLVLESDRRAADKAVLDLQDSGHRVERCHEVDLPEFPCNALRGNESCPVESRGGVDVVVDYRAHPHPRPTGLEDGVTCAVRHHVPLVVAGTSALNPYDRWTTSIATDDDIVEACERAARQPIERLGAPARTEVRRRLGSRPALAARADVVVRRSQGELNAVVSVPAEAAELDGPLAVAVAGVLRAADPYSSRVNVAVERASPAIT